MIAALLDYVDRFEGYDELVKVIAKQAVVCWESVFKEILIKF